MKKGFIFSMTAIFFIGLVILFFSLYISIYQKSSYRERINVVEQKMSEFLRNSQGDDGESYDTKWCGVYYVYDPNIGLAEQSQLQKKKYCEDYETKRFI